jgi:hypothetical protein
MFNFFKKRRKNREQAKYIRGYEWVCSEVLVKGTTLFAIHCKIAYSIATSNYDQADFDNGAKAAANRLSRLLCVDGLTEFDQHNGNFQYWGNLKLRSKDMK